MCFHMTLFGAFQMGNCSFDFDIDFGYVNSFHIGFGSSKLKPGELEGLKMVALAVVVLLVVPDMWLGLINGIDFVDKYFGAYMPNLGLYDLMDIAEHFDHLDSYYLKHWDWMWSLHLRIDDW
jgi:hypothetical protein